MAELTYLQAISEGLREAMRSDERLREVPVVVVSAWQTPEDREAVTAAGADAFLAKPFELEALTAIVQELLERRR